MPASSEKHLRRSARRSGGSCATPSIATTECKGMVLAQTCVVVLQMLQGLRGGLSRLALSL